MVEWLVYKTHVGELCPLVIHNVLELELKAGKNPLFKIGVCGNQNRVYRVFVVLTCLESEDTVFHHIVSANSVSAGNRVQFND